MKALYFDCSSGISGNMTLGALLEILGDETYLINELKKLNIDGYDIKISKQIKNSITGTYVDVVLEDNHNHHEHRHLNDVNNIIDNSGIDEKSKELSKKIFLRVAKAEAKVHNKKLEEVHFHEVGAIDSIVDIVGTAILINRINPDKIISSIVNDGYGFIECAHGMISVPVPATSQIFAESKAKIKQIEIESELVTPTGAAIITELSTEFIHLPEMKIEKIGWGLGTKNLKIPNVLKVYYGEIEEQKEDSKIVVMETNIDDSNSEILSYTMEKLFEKGALDVFYTPIYMKKNRPSYKMSVICKENNISQLQDIIFKHTTSIGIRYHYEYRNELQRQIVEISTKYGNILAKKVKNKDEYYIYPEYGSIKKIADENNVSIKELYKLEQLNSNYK